MYTITEKEYSTLKQQIYNAFMTLPAMGMGEMGAAEEEAEAVASKWLKDTGTHIKDEGVIPFSGKDSEMCQKYAALINPELEDWDRECRFLICDLTGAYIQIGDSSYYTQAGGDEIQGTREECIKFIQENI